MANAQNQYNYVLRERKKILEEIEQLKNEKYVRRYLLLKEKDKILEKKQNSLDKELLYNKFCNCNHILVYTEIEHDYFAKNTNRTFACVKCGLDSAILRYHRDFLTGEKEAMYKYLVMHPFLERSIELFMPCNINLARKVFQKTQEKYPNASNTMLRKCFYFNLKYNIDRIAAKKMIK